MLKQQLQIKLSQKLSPQQIKLMKLIQLSTLDLEQKIEAEMGENPALESGVEAVKSDNQENGFEENTKIETRHAQMLARFNGWKGIENGPWGRGLAQ